MWIARVTPTIVSRRRDSCALAAVTPAATPQTRPSRGSIPVSIIGWIIIGGIAGWLASLIMGTNERQGCILNIVLGIVGAFVGGLVWSLITGADFIAEFSLGTLLIATLGAVIILAIYRAVAARG
jgi:uncharacterized membrane protein YeaQ/YmgE (transglycosylase-associated protein family)